MKCNRIHKEIARMELEINPDNWPLEVRAHLSECPECRLTLERVNQTLALIESERQLHVNPFIYTRIEQALHKPIEKSAWLLRKAFLRPVFLAVFIVAVIGFGVLSGKQIDNALNASNQNLSPDEQVQYLARDYYLQDFDNQLIDTVLANE